MLNKEEKIRVLYVATFVWSEWKRFCDMAGNDSWAHRDRIQAHRDALQAMKVAKLIDGFDLDQGVLFVGLWHKKIPELGHLPKFKKIGKPVPI